MVSPKNSLAGSLVSRGITVKVSWRNMRSLGNCCVQLACQVWGIDWAGVTMATDFVEGTVLHIVKKLSEVFRTHHFIGAFSTARHLYLSWARSVQSSPFLPICCSESHASGHFNVWQVAQPLFVSLCCSRRIYREYFYRGSEYDCSCTHIQRVPKPMPQTSPGYSPPLIKQKSSYQHGSKSEQVPRYPLTFMCGYPLSIT